MTVKLTCQSCIKPATYAVICVTVAGEVFHFHTCTEHAAGGHDFMIANNDPGFAGPESVLRSISYNALPVITDAPRPAEKEWT